MTNYEKIKAMSVEEMANAFYNIISCEDCPFINQCVKKYSCYCSGGKKCREMIIECLESEVEKDG